MRRSKRACVRTWVLKLDDRETKEDDGCGRKPHSSLLAAERKEGRKERSMGAQASLRFSLSLSLSDDVAASAATTEDCVDLKSI